MRFNKKGTELSMNVIIIAAIAILILVILAMFVFRSSGKVNDGTSCESLSGKCQATCGGDYPINNIAFASSCGNGQKCCMPVGVVTN